MTLIRRFVAPRWRRSRGGGGVVVAPPAYDPATDTSPFTSTRGDEVVTSGSDITQVTDRSGNGRHWSQGNASLRPSVGTIGGQPGIVFDGIDEYVIGTSLAPLTEGTVAIVAQLDNDVPAAVGQTGFWDLGTSVSTAHVPFTDGLIYEEAGSTMRKDSIAANPVADLSVPFLYVITSATMAWSSYINNVLHSTTAVNVVGFPGVPFVGRDQGNTRFLQGVVGEWHVWDRILDAAEQTELYDYARARYAGMP